MLPLKKAAEEKAQAMRAAAAASFKSMLKERGDMSFNSRWARVWVHFELVVFSYAQCIQCENLVF